VSATVNTPSVLSVTLSTPLRDPPCVGSKNTPIAQLDPEATEFPQLLSGPKSAVLVLTFEIVTAAEPLFVSVTVCGRPVVPTY
jgi:hypothetical protein